MQIVHAVVFLVFGIGGGVLMGRVAPMVLNWVYQLLSPAITRSADPGARPFSQSDTLSIAPLVLMGAILGGWLSVRLLNVFERLLGRWDRMEVGDKANVFLGALVGLFFTYPVLAILQNIPLDNLAKAGIVVAVILGLSALCVYLLQSMAEVLPWSRDKARSKRSGIKVLDTNVIIDGRIYDVAKTGFLEGTIYVPGFVLDELQFIADSHDGLKRQRGRRGLEVLRHMQSDFPMEVRVHDRLAPEGGDGVDSRLVRLAKALAGDIVTNDFNLNRVAALQGIKVLNINDLTLSLRPNVLPSESLELTLIREGKEPGQGVGYLDDGTMVVVENGKAHLGETMDVVVKQVIQTERGKMIFAEVDAEEEPRTDFRTEMRRKPSARKAGN
jgi:uncharacterized protein YacL